MEALLKKYTPDYRTFLDDQVLTADQLNEFISYFEDQDRLSRVCLTGVGIVCGFKVTFHADHKQISILQGCGVTTDGDLLKLQVAIPEEEQVKNVGIKSVLYTHFREFEDDKANYSHFILSGDDENIKRIPLWELIPEAEADEDAGHLSLNEMDFGDGQSKIALLYLESYPKNPDICTETNCDNQGERQVRRLRVLLVNESDISVLTEKDSIFSKFDVFDAYELLPEIKMPRVLLQPPTTIDRTPPKLDLSDLIDLGIFRPDLVFDVSNLNVLDVAGGAKKTVVANSILNATNESTIINNPNTLRTEARFDALSNFSRIPGTNTITYSALAQSYRSAISSTINQLIDAFNTLHAQFNGLINLDVAVKSQIVGHLSVLKTKLTDTKIQYAYDHVKDVAQSYAGIKNLLIRLQAICCPPVNAFPKHLLLGKISSPKRFDKYRHDFYHSPANADKEENIQRVKTLFHKIASMCADFNVPSRNSARITPSNLSGGMFNAERRNIAIPFYYSISENLLRAWDFNKTSIYRERYNLSYHTDQLQNVPQVQTPLRYDLDEFDFLRIEGIQGMKYTDALRAIEKIKKDNGLAFDIKALSIDQRIDDINMDEYACHFYHLETALKAWTAEQNCLNAEVTKFFSGFNMRNLGVHNYTAEIFNLAPKKTLGNVVKEATNTLSLDPEGVIEPTSARTNTRNTVFDLGRSDSNFSSVLMNTGINYISPIKIEKQVNTTVKDTLQSQEDDLGFLMKDILKVDYVGNHRDLYADILGLYEKLYPERPKADPDVTAITLEIPTTLLSLLQVASSYVPANLNEIDEAQQKNFSAAMDELCKFINTARAKANNIFYGPNTKYKKVGYEQKYMLLLNRIQENCCAAEQLEVFIEEIQKKKTEILESLRLDSFAKKHPGLEHKAGVPMGGTFVMVYAGTKREDEDKNIPLNTVVADFCLPYMCCSDCSPIGFIIPETVSNSSLLLDKDRICVAEDGKVVKVAFTVSPSDGVVALASEKIEGVEIKSGNITITPKKLNAYDRPIALTVNGLPTTAQLTVIKKPKFKVTTRPEKVQGAPGTMTDVVFLVENQNNFDTSQFTVKWKIGEKEYTGEKAMHTISIDQSIDGNSFTIPYAVNVVGELCSTQLDDQQLTVEVVRDVDTIISMKENTFCQNDNTEHPISVIPPSENAEVTGKGVIQSENGFSFVPAVAGEGNHTIKLKDGNSLVVTVRPHPQRIVIADNYNSETRTLTITASENIDGATYIWNFNGEILDGETESIITMKVDRSVRGVLTLELRNGSCGNLKSNSLNIDVNPDEDQDNNTCHNNTLRILSASQAKLVSIMKSELFKELITNRIEKTLFSSVNDFYTQVLNDVSFLDGKQNEMVQQFIAKQLPTLKKLIESADGQKRTILLQLHRIVLELNYNVLRCQNPERLKEVREARTTGQIEADFDTTNEQSFISQVIKDIDLAETSSFFSTFNTLFKNTPLSGHFETIIKNLKRR